MKRFKYIIWVLTILVLIIFIGYMLNNKNINDIMIQVIEFDNFENTEKNVEEIKIKVGDIINLEKYDGNNIKILEINESSVKISRKAVRFEIIEQTPLNQGESKEYFETVIESVNFNDLIPINIDSLDPFGPRYVMARYVYKIKFIK